MIERLINTNVSYNCPNDLDEKWVKWLKELEQIKNNIEILDETTTEYGKEINFYFDSVFNTKIYFLLEG